MSLLVRRVMIAVVPIIAAALARQVVKRWTADDRPELGAAAHGPGDAPEPAPVA